MYLPKDYAEMGRADLSVTKHCVERYGKTEVEWYWETWNESNIGYWRGTPEEFRKLHDYAIDAVRRALPTARVGGPDSAGSGGQFNKDFIEHCLRGTNYATGKTGTPIDFISFHAKGSPKFVDGHVQTGIANQLQAMDKALTIASPGAKNKPIIIGESDPDGAACQGVSWLAIDDVLSYTAASFVRAYDWQTNTAESGSVDVAFAEDQPYFAGCVLATKRHRSAGPECLSDVSAK